MPGYRRPRTPWTTGSCPRRSFRKCSRSLVLAPSRLFVDAGDAFTTAHFLRHVLDTQIVEGQQDEHVIDDVGRLPDDLQTLAFLAGHDQLGTFLADFLQ